MTCQKSYKLTTGSKLLHLESAKDQGCRQIHFIKYRYIYSPMAKCKYDNFQIGYFQMQIVKMLIHKLCPSDTQA